MSYRNPKIWARLALVSVLLAWASGAWAAVWTIEVVDNSADVGKYVQLLHDGSDRIVTCYYDATNGDLRTATRTDTGWVAETVVSAGNVGRYPWLAYDTLGQRSFSYQNVDRTSLEFAGFVEPMFHWGFETVDSEGDPTQPSVLFGLDSSLLVSYYDNSGGNLRLARQNQSTWSAETVDSTYDVGKYASLSQNRTDSTLLISYYDATHGDLRAALTTKLTPSQVQVVPDSVLILSPAGSVPYRVRLLDSLGNLLVSAWDVQVDFSHVSGITPCTDYTYWPVVYANSLTDDFRAISFRPRLSGCTSDSAAITSFGSVIAKVPVRSLDRNGSGRVTVADFVGDACNDYNNDGIVNDQDFHFFEQHIEETCQTDVSSLVTVWLYTDPGPEAIYQGDTIHVCARVNNTAGFPLELNHVTLHAAGWGIAYPWAPLPDGQFSGDVIPGRDSLDFCTQFVVPVGIGHGCFQARVLAGYPDKSNDPQSERLRRAERTVQRNVEAPRRWRPPSSQCPDRDHDSDGIADDLDPCDCTPEGLVPGLCQALATAGGGCIMGRGPANQDIGCVEPLPSDCPQRDCNTPSCSLERRSQSDSAEFSLSIVPVGSASGDSLRISVFSFLPGNWSYELYGINDSGWMHTPNDLIVVVNHPGLSSADTGKVILYAYNAAGDYAGNAQFWVYESPQPFVCGDASGDATVDISDAVYLISYIFSGGPAPNPLLSGDASCDSTVDISDAVYLISYIFSGGLAPCAECP